jgi:DNA-binding IclR family transcriptional regulator
MCPPLDKPERAQGCLLLTNAALVLVVLAREPETRIRDVARHVGVTERAAQRLVSGLVSSGYLERERVGRRNRYELVPDAPLRHTLVAERSVGSLVSALGA